jgi:hypothetical protein
MTAYVLILERLSELGSKIREQYGYAMAQCPAHDDRNPSLAIYPKEGKAKVVCYAGCSDVDVLAALGLTIRDLYDNPGGRYNPERVFLTKEVIDSELRDIDKRLEFLLINSSRWGTRHTQMLRDAVALVLRQRNPETKPRRVA